MSNNIEQYNNDIQSSKLDRVFKSSINMLNVEPSDFELFEKNVKNQFISFIVHNKLYVVFKDEETAKKCSGLFLNKLTQIVNKELGSNYALIFIDKNQLSNVPEYAKKTKKKMWLTISAVTLVSLMFTAALVSLISILVQ